MNFSCAESNCRRYGKISETNLDVEFNCTVFIIQIYDSHMVMLKNNYTLSSAHEKHGV